MKYLEIDTTKKEEINNKVTLKYVKGEMKKWKDVPNSWMRRLNAIKITPNFNSVGIFCVCFWQLGKVSLKFLQKNKYQRRDK